MTQPARPPRRHFVGQLSRGTPTSASLDFTGRNILTAFLTLAFAFSAFSQTVSTEILGLVTDSTGAVIPGANVTAKRVATGDVRTTTTNETGNYVFPLLDIGEYEITCSVSGFKTELMHGIVLRLQEKARLNFQLQVGQQVETVEVSGATQLLRTEDATLGSVVESKRVVDLPLNGRNFGQLATLMPGVVIGSRMGFDGQGGIPIPGQMVAISANGQRDINQNATLDGVVGTEPRNGTMPFVPSIEAIEEFKVQSAVYSAEYGMNSGAQVNVAIKSGTNQLHATLFEFVRNDMFDARGYFLPPEQAKNKLRRNQYGAVASRPVRKNKTFWLFNWEARQERRATPAVASVPTLEMRAGNFSEILQNGNRWYPGDANSASTRAIRAPGSSAPFPNNIIPASLIPAQSKICSRGSRPVRLRRAASSRIRTSTRRPERPAAPSTSPARLTTRSPTISTWAGATTDLATTIESSRAT
jgi:hypothetical protein